MKKTEKLNYNGTMKYANKLLQFNSSWARETNENDFTKITFGLLLKLCLKTGIRASDLLSLKYDQFKEDRLHPNSYNLTYYITKTKTTATVPVPVEVILKIQEYEMLCKGKYGYTHANIFFNYRNEKTFSRVWASKKVAQANKKGLLGEIINVAGMHSVRRTAVVEVYEKIPDLRLAQAFLGHKNILTTSNYLQDNKTTTQDKLREALC